MQVESLRKEISKVKVENSSSYQVNTLHDILLKYDQSEK